MSRNTKKGALVVLVLSLFSWWLWQGLEWTKQRRWIGAVPEVRERPLMAAGLFLEAQGLSVSRLVNQLRLDDIPQTVGTLFICEGRMQLSLAHYQEIERWMESGGHLVINAAGVGGLYRNKPSEADGYGLRSESLTELYRERGIEQGNRIAAQNCWRQIVDFEPEDAISGPDEARSALAQQQEVLPIVRYVGALPGEALPQPSCQDP